MNAQQRIQREILIQAFAECTDLVWNGGEITVENLGDAWDVLVEADLSGDCLEEFRCSGEDSGIPSQYSRHYECKEKARQLSDGSWVGWTYWFGGGKWGEPRAMDWLEYAYDVTMTEEIRVVRVFTKELL